MNAFPEAPKDGCYQEIPTDRPLTGSSALIVEVARWKACAETAEAKVTSLERELAMIEAGYQPSRLRTPGAVEVCGLCFKRFIPGLCTEGNEYEADCPIKRAHSPAAKEAE